MAYGFIKILPASTHVDIALSGSGGGTQYPSIKVLNPNDGVLYLARNRDCMSTGYGDWDWKVPSQSYAAVPGPFQSVGAFYLDQSGAGHPGEITVYPSQQQLDDPLFNAIGRALLSAQTTLDITETTIPLNPGSGLARLWADGSDQLHLLNSAGVDETFLDNRSIAGGVLSGVYPNPGFATNPTFTGLLSAANGAFSGNLSATGNFSAANLTSNNVITATAYIQAIGGTYYFQDGSHYLAYAPSGHIYALGDGNMRFDNLYGLLNPGNSVFFRLQNTLTLANTATANLIASRVAMMGLVFIYEENGNGAALYYLKSSLHASAVIASVGGPWGTTFGPAGINIAWSGSNLDYVIENKMGGTIYIDAFAFGIA